MSYTYEELKGKTVAELREISKSIEHEALQGYSQLNKEHLLVALCKALSIDTRAHHIAETFNRAAVKAKIHQWQAARDKAVLARDYKALGIARAKIHRLKHAMRKAEV